MEDGNRISEYDSAAAAELTSDTVLIINTPTRKTKKTTLGEIMTIGPSVWTTNELSSDDSVANRTRTKCDASGGAFTVVLPPVTDTYEVKLKKIDASSNAVTIQPAAVGLIDGAASIQLTSQWDAVSLYSDGANWFIDL